VKLTDEDSGNRITGQNEESLIKQGPEATVHRDIEGRGVAESRSTTLPLTKKEEVSQKKRIERWQTRARKPLTRRDRGFLELDIKIGGSARKSLLLGVRAASCSRGDSRKPGGVAW
jgi:hypothetical protein